MGDFVGRQRELAELVQALDGALAGRGGLALVAGEPGIGKTRLVRELADGARARGVPVWWGRCPDAEGAPAFWPWTQVLRSAGSVPDALAPLLGESDAPIDDAGARFRLFDAATRFLAAAGPVIVVLDDLQWADPASMNLLQHVAPELPGTKVLVIGTLRDVAGVVVDAHPSTRIHLAGLGASEIAALAGDAVVERAEGNPFFAIELARLAASEGSAVVPAGVRESIRRRVAGLGHELEAAFAAAATIGREFDLDVLAAVLGSGVEELLTRAEDAALVAEVDVGRWRFAHDLVRETFLDDLRPRDRADLHARVADALDLLHAGDPAWSAAVALHVLGGASVHGDATRVVRATAAAAKEAAARQAPEDAVRLFEIARNWLPRSTLVGTPEEYELLMGLGRAHLVLTRDEDSRAAFLAAAESAAARGDGVARAEAVLAIGWERYLGLQYVPPVDALDRAIDGLAGARPDLRARLLVRRAAVGADDGKARAGLAREALEAARRSGDAYAITLAVGNLLVDWPLAVPVDERASFAAELYEATAAVGTREAAFMAEAVRCKLLLERGEIFATLRMVPELEAAGREVGTPANGGFDLTRPLLATATGHLDEAEELVQAFLESTPPGFMEWALPVYVGQLTTLRWLQGRGAEMAPVLESLVGTEDAEVAIATLAMLHADAGHLDDAARVVASLGDAAIDELVWQPFGVGLLGLGSLAVTAVRLNDRRLAERLARHLRPLSGTILLAGMPPVLTVGAVDTVLGALSALLEDFDAAERYFESGAALSRQMPPFLAHNDCLWAEARLAAGDPVRAAELARSAHRVAERLGMAALERDAASIEAAARPASGPAAFVGRDRELAELEAAVAAARTGRGAVALIGGEPGIGKTRLASEVADLATARGVPVAWGRCPEDGAPPYWPWTQVLRSLGIDDDAVAPLLGAASDEVDEGARFRLLDAAGRVISASGPALIVMDDAQWADAASIDVLTHLASALSESSVLVVVTYRDVEVVKGHPFSDAIAKLVRTPRATRVELRGLRDQEVSSLAANAGLSESDIATIVRRSEGNPFFTEELVRLAAAGGAVGIPGGVREVIRQRVERLGKGADDVLAVAAVIGRDLELALLEAVAGEAAEAVLGRAHAAGLIAEVPDRFGWWRFTHDLVRETLYDDLSASRRVRAHDRVAVALESLHADDPAWLSPLAHHALAAAPAGNARRAVRWATKAAADAAGRHAHEDAGRLYTAALEWLGRISDADPLERCDLLTARGRSEFLRGDHLASRASLLEAANLAGDDGVRLAQALVSIGEGLVAIPGVTDVPVTLLRRALAFVPAHDEKLRAELLVRLAVNLPWGSDESLECYEDALAIARRIGDARLHVYALCCHWTALPAAAHIATKLAVADELDRVDVDGAPVAEIVSRGFLAHVRLLDGDAQAASADLDEMMRLACVANHEPWIFYARRAVAGLSVLRGEYDRAHSEIEALLGGRTRVLAWTVLHRDLNEHERLLPSIQRAVETDASGALVPNARAFAALLLAETGHGDRAAAELAAATTALERAGRSIGEDIARCWMAEAAAWLGDAETAARVYDWLSPFSGHVVHHAVVDICPGAGDFYLGLCAATLGRDDDAEQHYRSALQLNERIGARPMVARTKYWWARLRGNAALAEESRSLAEELGMEMLAAQAADLVGPRPAVPSTPAADGTVTLVFTDIESSTELTARMGDKAWAAALAEHTAVVRRLAGEHGGRLVKALGDGFMLAFPSARRGLDCVIAIHEEIADGPVQIRVGVHTGEAVQLDGDYIGHHVNLTSRIAAAAKTGEVLVSSIVRDITASAGDLAFGPARRVTLRGIAEPIAVHRFLWGSTNPDEPAASTTPHPEGRHVGRETELQELDRGEPVAPEATTTTGTFRPEGEFWTVTFDGQTVRMKDSKGMGYLGQLLARPGQEQHALTLVGTSDEADRSDAGPVLDTKSKEAYRQRLGDLAEDLEEALANHDPARAEKAQAEIDALTDQLTAAVGLGGRDRKAASASERARVGVTRTIRSAIARIADAHPSLGAHLGKAIRTGTYCAYEPDPRVPITWRV